MASETKIDDEQAGLMLAAGATVRDVANRYGVSTQAIYLAISQGRLPRRSRAHGGPLGDDISPDATHPAPACAGSDHEPTQRTTRK